MDEIRAISIKQTFAELILLGKKKFEFRSMSTSIRGRVYIYASLKPRPEQELWWKQQGVLIVGSVEIVGCRGNKRDRYAYVLKNPARLRKPMKPRNHAPPVF